MTEVFGSYEIDPTYYTESTCTIIVLGDPNKRMQFDNFSSTAWKIEFINTSYVEGENYTLSYANPASLMGLKGPGNSYQPWQPVVSISSAKCFKYNYGSGSSAAVTALKDLKFTLLRITDPAGISHYVPIVMPSSQESLMLVLTYEQKATTYQVTVQTNAPLTPLVQLV